MAARLIMVQNQGLADASATRKPQQGGSFDKNTTAASEPHKEYPHKMLTKKTHKELPKRIQNVFARKHQEHWRETFNIECLLFVNIKDTVATKRTIKHLRLNIFGYITNPL